jgi:hypothetical protein
MPTPYEVLPLPCSSLGKKLKMVFYSKTKELVAGVRVEMLLQQKLKCFGSLQELQWI